MHLNRYSLAVPLLLVATAAPLRATSSDIVDPVTRSDAPPTGQPPENDVLRLGKFMLSGRIVTSAYYDDNLFATQNDTVDDAVLLLSPSLQLVSDWQKHALRFRGGADLARYADYGSEDYNDYWLDSKGRYEPGGRLELFGGAGLRRAHEDRGSENDANGSEPTQYTERTANAGVSLDYGGFNSQAGVSYTDLDYHDVDASVGVIDNDDRDRSIGAAALRLSHALNETWQGFVHCRVEQRDYARSVASDGFRRSSDGYRVAVGLDTDQTGRLIGELSAGYLQQDYDDPRFDTVREADFSASLKWKAATNSLLKFHAVRSLEESTLAGSPAYLYTRYGVRLDQRVTPRLYADIGMTLGTADYYQSDRDDDYTLATAGLAWIHDKRTSLSLDWYIQQRDSSVADEDYRRQRVVASVAVKF
jgi:hypothetical protein